ncbi:MAG: beta strand repeat-containing protein [Phormidesmis sp.]
MAKTKKQKTFRWLAHKPLLAAALAVAGVFNMMSAVLAEGTAAGTGISNTATATYSDGTTNFDAVSNTVVINVAEIAGLTVTNSGFADPNGGSIVNGDEVTFDFLVTNTGNADTDVFVPGLTALQPLAVGGTITAVEIVDPLTGNVLDTVDPAGESTSALTGVGPVVADGTFTVRITMDVTAPNTGDPVSVQFGDTSDNNTAPADGSQNQQNIRDDSDPAANPADVRTINIGPDAPVNGEREAANFRQEQIDTAPSTALAQATVLKTSTYSDSGTNTNGNDDTIAYGLTFNVGNQTIAGLAAGSLEGTDISVDRGTGAVTENRVLVSDVIPANTVFDSATTPTAPANWEVVYSTDDPVTTGNNALQSTWTTTQPATASDIKRIGFIYNAEAAPAGNGAIAPGTSFTNFGFSVITSGIPASTDGSFVVANIAQAFGETEGDTGNTIVFDESGDQNFNNYADGVTPTTTATTFNPATDDGIANPLDPEQNLNANDGLDTDPDSTSNGESNVVPITVAPAPTANTLVNGPVNTASAIGPTDNNDDFTNVAVALPTVDVGPLDSTGGNPDAITITNTVQNPATAPVQLDTVTLVPLSATDAKTAADALVVAPATAGGDYGANTDLPNGTVVTIAFGTQSAQYTYNSTTGSFGTPVSTNTPQPNGPVVVGSLAIGAFENYTVTIDLPAGTPQIRGYAVPVVAFVDNDGNGAFTVATEQTANITVDRVYNGFMNLVKTASVDGGTTVSDGTGTPGNPAIPDLQPGEEVIYKIDYTNVSEAAPAAPAAGNITLNANDFLLIEDGNAGTNNWAPVTLHQNGTTFTTGAIEYLNGGATLGATDPADDDAVTVYRNLVGTVQPGGTGNLQFIRKVQ